MLAFITKRLILAIVTLLLASALVFFAMRWLPGDPILMLVTNNQAQELSEEYAQALREKNGLDKPVVVQYFNWLGGVLQGDFGNSILSQAPVSDEVARRLPISIYVGGLALFLGYLLGIPAGIVCAVRRGKWIDTVITTMANIGITVPNFLLGIVLMYLLGLRLGWLPIMGFSWPTEDFWLSTKQLIMPVICLALFPLAAVTRQMRSSMLEVMNQDYIRTAWSKGLRERVIVAKHAFKNGMIPIVTLAGLGIAQIIGGAAVIETVFNVNGIGRLAVASVINQDYPYVQAIALIVSAVVIMTNLLVDIAYGWLDPRIRYG